MSTHTVERGGINVNKWELGEEEEKQRAEKKWIRMVEKAYLDHIV